MPPTAVAILSRPLPDLLTDSLINSTAYRWPGADGFLLADILREYPAAAASRQVPGELDLCDRHPELTAQVVAFFFRHTIADTHHA